MGSYYRDPRMFIGSAFICFNCNKKLAVKMGGSDFHIELSCPRCKTFYFIECKESIPFVQELNKQSMINEGAK